MGLRSRLASGICSLPRMLRLSQESGKDSRRSFAAAKTDARNSISDVCDLWVLTRGGHCPCGRSWKQADPETAARAVEQQDAMAKFLERRGAVVHRLADLTPEQLLYNTEMGLECH